MSLGFLGVPHLLSRKPGPWAPCPFSPGPFLAAEASRNESCSDLPEIQNGWKTTSHTELVREAKITYQCDPGYDIVGSDTLTCQWDLTWSSDPPFCEKSMALPRFYPLCGCELH